MEILSANLPRVLALHPSHTAWPANILRVHVVFDCEMNPMAALASIRIETSDGEPLRSVLVDLPDGLWSPDGRILTLLFHPGRLKRGLRAHELLGKALQPGRAYRLVIGPGLTDIDGRDLSPTGPFVFEVGPPQDAPIDPFTWEVSELVPGGFAPLVVTTGTILDALSALGGLGVVSPAGGRHPVSVLVEGTKVILVPRFAWPDGARLRISPGLEDVCGNRVDHAFERPFG
ncbi:hypothetical protein GWI72_13590 [Microvirga tunisiensis]|uniref:Uncharacterized protein n=2 Tax=Pannonibacter tanglangensis TaxID=2750084 RepID=A0A7X5J909_9HYPH|nr:MULTISPECIES: Ig-like domain-containing protein [unclassified Pannonibacter]NBN64803.1 hypothetical protein [Pannonibacter sp. XCT-34]NBN79304.1 hypothetical protein [Pannonibacter sp. XCT-53]